VPLIVRRWGPVAAVMAVIFVGSEQPAVRRAPATIEFLVAKISHVLEFAALGAALFRAISPPDHPTSARAIAVAVAISTVYAASDEFHQTFTPGRTATLRDVAIDLLGAVAGSAGYAKFRQSRSGQSAAGIY
jgi:VanZ family protein